MEGRERGDDGHNKVNTIISIFFSTQTHPPIRTAFVSLSCLPPLEIVHHGHSSSSSSSSLEVVVVQVLLLPMSLLLLLLLVVPPNVVRGSLVRDLRLHLSSRAPVILPATAAAEVAAAAAAAAALQHHREQQQRGEGGDGGGCGDGHGGPRPAGGRARVAEVGLAAAEADPLAVALLKGLAPDLAKVALAGRTAGIRVLKIRKK